MNSIDTKARRRGLYKLACSLLSCVICVSLNIIGSRIASHIGANLYLDNVGTLLAAMYGGYLPGVICGYLTNLVAGLTDGVSFFYGVISVLIGLMAGHFADRGWFKSVWKTILAVLAFSVVAGGLSSIITWFLYGLSYGDGITASLAGTLERGGAAPEVAQLISNMAIDTIDKAITVIIALAIKRLLPDRVSDFIDFELWQQAPLSDEERERLRKSSHPRIVSAHAKIAGIMSFVLISSVTVNTGISFVTFRDNMAREQTIYAQGITHLLCRLLDPERIDDFLEFGEAAEGYKEAEREMVEVRDSFEGVEYVYAYRVLEDGCHVVLDPDTKDAPGSEPGEVIEFDQAFMSQLDDLLNGREITPIVSNESYGWLLTVYEPLYDKDGTCVCYVCADVSMDRIVTNSYAFITRTVALFCAFFILMCSLVIWIAEYAFTLPLDSIANAMANFAFSITGDRQTSLKELRSLDIHTGDEIENLYEAVDKTAGDTVDYIEHTREQNETIARMQDNLIMVMADLVESRDQFTGDHVRKTAAYAAITMAQMRREGIYADQLTDQFVSNVVHSAPLHDIGKIVVPDAILNKPGRLTDEEFEAMKSHTTAGYDILEHAVSAVSEPTYLDEAKNLARYHHEKWSGGGYPTGISGTDIPLSARIMAVADVFDALVSKRSYKEGFPLAKAFSIIEEGAGTHFDPLIAKAFLDVKDEAAAIATYYGDGQTDKIPWVPSDGTPSVAIPPSAPQTS